MSQSELELAVELVNKDPGRISGSFLVKVRRCDGCDNLYPIPLLEDAKIEARKRKAEASGEKFDAFCGRLSCRGKRWSQNEERKLKKLGGEGDQ